MVLGSLLAGLVLAWCLRVAYDNGWYLIFLLPIFGGMALGGVLMLLVGWARCRNRWLAGIVGIAAGLVAYLGYYELCLLETAPPGAAWRADLLPRYIEVRMRSDVARDLGRPEAAERNKEPSTGLNWYTFVCELAIVTGFAAVCAWRRAGRAYCTELGQWMKREKALLPPNSVAGLREALDRGALEDFVASTIRGSDAQVAWGLTLEYAAPDDGLSLSYPVYASLEPPAGKGFRKVSPGSGGQAFRQVKLETSEVLLLRPWFPKLAQLLACQHEELRDLPPNVTAVSALEATTSELAQITPVPEPYRQRVRSKGYVLKVNLIGLMTGVYFFGGAGLAALGYWLATQRGVPQGWAAVVIGAVGVAWGGYLGLYCPSVPENRWINRRLRREISQRPDATVDPRDPESFYVSLIPRESFSKIQWTMSSDLLLMKIDARGGQLILEGDCDRYRIPAGAISLCQPQCFFHPVDNQHRNEIWMVQLMVRVKEGMRELLLSVDHVRLTPKTNASRRRLAEEYCRRITSLVA